MFTSPHLFFEGGNVRNLGSSNVGTNESITNGSEVWMEVDLRSGESEKRTLHWIVDGKTQKVFFKQLPSNVQFGVCISSCLNLYSFVFILLLVQIGWCNGSCASEVEFISFEEMHSPSITPIPGSVAVEWK